MVLGSWMSLWRKLKRYLIFMKLLTASGSCERLTLGALVMTDCPLSLGYKWWAGRWWVSEAWARQDGGRHPRHPHGLSRRWVSGQCRDTELCHVSLIIISCISWYRFRYRGALFNSSTQEKQNDYKKTWGDKMVVFNFIKTRFLSYAFLQKSSLFPLL